MKRKNIRQRMEPKEESFSDDEMMRAVEKAIDRLMMNFMKNVMIIRLK